MSARPLPIRVEVDCDSPAKAALAAWLRDWRRRGVRRRGKTTYLHQGVSEITEFVAPEAAIGDLQLRLAGDRSASVTRLL